MKHLLPLFVILSACTSPSSSEPLGNSGASLDYPTLVARMIRANCAASFDCCSAEERTDVAYDFPDYETCVRETESRTLEAQNAVVSMIDRGAALFDQTEAARCIAEVEASTCHETFELWNRFDGFCAGVLRGTAPLGADCSESFAVLCESGICDDGVCVALPRLGEACRFFCEVGVCTVDEICGASALEGAPCMRDTQCELGLYCEGESYEGGAPNPGVCAPIGYCQGM